MERSAAPFFTASACDERNTSAAAAHESWLHIPSARAEKRARLLWLPHAGGSATSVHHWAKELPADVEFAAVQLPGRSFRLKERPYRRVEPLLAALDPALEHWGFDLPYVLFGHSMGALLAYELTERLRRAGRPLPTALVVSARRAPHLPSRRPMVHAASDREFIAALGEYQGMPSQVLRDPDMLAMVLPSLRADFEIIECHEPARYEPLPIPIYACGGDGDPSVTENELAAWGEATAASFELKLFRGGHFYIQEHERELLALVRRALATVSST